MSMSDRTRVFLSFFWTGTARCLKNASMTAFEKKEKQRMRCEKTAETEEAWAQTTLNDENNRPYKTKNTLGKAVSKLKRALPATPNREIHLLLLGAILCSMPSEQRNELCNTVKEPNVPQA